MSLRLTEAFLRTAVPEGHEPIRTLQELREHMDGPHEFGVARYLPQSILMSMHEESHRDLMYPHGRPAQEPRDPDDDDWWTADAAHSPGFIARRTTMGSVWEHGGDWDRAMHSLGEAGFPDSQMKLDTGHRLWVYHQGAGGGGLYGGGPQYGFHVSVWHPGGDAGHNVEGYLGEHPEHVGPLLRHMFGHPDVLGHMRDQMSRAQGRGEDQTGNRLMIDMTGGR